MQTKQFHLGDVLSITTPYLVSPRGIDGVRDILNFMTGDKLAPHQLPRAGDECKPYLVEQFPELTGADMDSAIAELEIELRFYRDAVHLQFPRSAEEIVLNWLAKQVAKHGEMFAVKPIPTGAHEVKNPIVEAVEMMGGSKKVIVVGV